MSDQSPIQSSLCETQRDLLVKAARIVSYPCLAAAMVSAFGPVDWMSEQQHLMLQAAACSSAVFVWSLLRPGHSLYWIILGISLALLVEFLQPLFGRAAQWSDIAALSTLALVAGAVGASLGALCWRRDWVARLLTLLPFQTAAIALGLVLITDAPARFANPLASLNTLNAFSQAADTLERNVAAVRPKASLAKTCSTLSVELAGSGGGFLRTFPLSEQQDSSCLLLMHVSSADYREPSQFSPAIGTLFFQLMRDETGCLCQFRLKVRFVDAARRGQMFDALIDALKTLERAAEFRLPANLETWRKNQRIPSFKSGNVEIRYWPERTTERSFNLYINF